MIDLLVSQFLTVCKTSRVMLELYRLSDEELDTLDVRRVDIPLIAYKSVLSNGAQ